MAGTDAETYDGAEFRVPKNIAIMSRLVEVMTEDGNDDEALPLMDVSQETLKKVLDFCEHHTDPAHPLPVIAKPLRSANMADLVSDWDAEYINLEQPQLFELILAANYMDIKPLLDLSCAKVASMMKGKTPEELRALFNIENDFTPEEEAQVREENRWVEEL